MGNVIVREHNDPWARIVRAAGRVASTAPGSSEHQLAKRYLKACEAAYLISEQCRLLKPTSKSIGE